MRGTHFSFLVLWYFTKTSQGTNDDTTYFAGLLQKVLQRLQMFTQDMSIGFQVQLTFVTEDLGVCFPANTGISVPIQNTFKHHSVEILWLFYHVHLTSLLIQLHFLFPPEDGVQVISSLKAAWLEPKVLSPRFPWSSEFWRKLLFFPALRNSWRFWDWGIRNQSQRFKNSEGK